MSFCDSNFSLILLLVSGPAPSALGLRSVAAKFVTPAAPFRRVAVPHTAAAAVGPVAPEVNAVAGARDFVAAVVSYLLLRLHPRLPLHSIWPCHVLYPCTPLLHKVCFYLFSHSLPPPFAY